MMNAYILRLTVGLVLTGATAFLAYQLCYCSLPNPVSRVRVSPVDTLSFEPAMHLRTIYTDSFLSLAEMAYGSKGLQTTNTHDSIRMIFDGGADYQDFNNNNPYLLGNVSKDFRIVYNPFVKRIEATFKKGKDKHGHSITYVPNDVLFRMATFVCDNKAPIR